MRTSVWVAVLCPPTGRVLLARRASGVHRSGLWNFLGGGLDPGEDVRMAASREVWEEGGLRCPPQALTVLAEAHDPEKRNVLLGTVVDREVVPCLNAEHDAWRWSPFAGLRNLGRLHPATARLAPFAHPFIRAAQSPFASFHDRSPLGV